MSKKICTENHASQFFNLLEGTTENYFFISGCNDDASERKVRGTFVEVLLRGRGVARGLDECSSSRTVWDANTKVVLNSVQDKLGCLR